MAELALGISIFSAVIAAFANTKDAIEFYADAEHMIFMIGLSRYLQDVVQGRIMGRLS